MGIIASAATIAAARKISKGGAAIPVSRASKESIPMHSAIIGPTTMGTSTVKHILTP